MTRGSVVLTASFCGRWAGATGAAAKLMTASYDGSVRCMDPVTASFQLLLTDPDAEYSALDCLADASSG